jgi:hypothetical protein
VRKTGPLIPPASRLASSQHQASGSSHGVAGALAIRNGLRCAMLRTIENGFHALTNAPKWVSRRSKIKRKYHELCSSSASKRRIARNILANAPNKSLS